ncbi:unnamed protein product [Fusarium graminearum]|uniref:Chromosome 1, complete genome n=2 Tax=Gibberella zeae TaxID=5518 RepID=A0A098D2C9_GIBZE|nr:unnamed protein product [Fusarium graminearum]CAF3549010.1 unnamed protein product [Fusarium graminearum]CAF3590181.1 unnamed protein product [Fusarium graminearum]CAG1963322.1 unnamed protein product [Fusarium graminearum]CAG1971895.1 unnamed protein product [Fusarium graminearum]
MHKPFDTEKASIVSPGSDINKSTPIQRAAVVAPDQLNTQSGPRQRPAQLEDEDNSMFRPEDIAV